MRIPIMSVGKFLRKEFMIPLDISDSQLAKEISVPVDELTQGLNDDQFFSYDTAFKISKYFGYSSNLVYNFQEDCVKRQNHRFKFNPEEEQKQFTSSK